MKFLTDRLEKRVTRGELLRAQESNEKAPIQLSRIVQKTIEASLIRRKRGRKPKIQNSEKDPEVISKSKVDENPFLMDWTPIFKTILVSRDSNGKIEGDINEIPNEAESSQNSDIELSDEMIEDNIKDDPQIWAQGIENVPCSEPMAEDIEDFPIRL
ncbi:unnamed protein product [Blepharisma stoltei]|uniref:Uncharacterized protein n=1 Tax=Blepharisma stoltei TaxID=1481888 RepID=A0AAU9IG57_9CILI|nr:unnamed protein product [Blepharisma stoltei]